MSFHLSGYFTFFSKLWQVNILRTVSFTPSSPTQWHYLRNNLSPVTEIDLELDLGSAEGPGTLKSCTWPCCCCMHVSGNGIVSCLHWEVPLCLSFSLPSWQFLALCSHLGSGYRSANFPFIHVTSFHSTAINKSWSGNKGGAHYTVILLDWTVWPQGVE